MQLGEFVARLFGTPTSVIPRSLSDFRDYFNAQIAGETITVTAPAREVAAVILEAPLPVPIRVLVPAHRLATGGLLPPRLRRDYGLRWSPLHERALPLAARSVRLATTPVLVAASRLAPTQTDSPRSDGHSPHRCTRCECSALSGGAPFGLGDDGLERRSDGLLPGAGHAVAPRAAEPPEVGPELAFPGQFRASF